MAIIVFILIFPVLKTIAFGGVLTGNMNPSDAAKIVPNAGAIGETPAPCAIAIDIGTMIVALAVLLAVSLTTAAITMQSPITTHGLP